MPSIVVRERQNTHISNMKKISILVPCCNVEQYVRECLDSIKAQTHTNIEVICINDGSTDSTGDIIDEYVASDPRFKAIHKSNSGYGDSMNKGLEVATGDYIGIVESDDWIEPNMYEVLYQTAETENLDLVRCLWKEGPTGTETIPNTGYVVSNKVYRPLDKSSVMFMPPSIWVALYRRDLLEEGRKIRFLPTPGASFQDTSFAFKVYTKATRFKMINKPLHHYRINPGSSVSSSGKAYCIIDEWIEMKHWIEGDKTLKGDMSGRDLLPRLIWGGFLWNYNRLNMIIRLWFLRRASQFFKECREDGILCTERLTAELQNDYNLIIDNPLAYHYQEIYRPLDSCMFSEKPRQKSPDVPQPLVTVIITCYNCSKYIQSSIESVRRQTYKNIEIICIDDCSTDETEVLVRHVMRKDNRIKFLSTNKNSGQSIARNTALRESKGEYVVFIDGDDYLFGDAVDKMLRNATDGVGLVVGSIHVEYEGGEKAWGELPSSDKRYYTNDEDELLVLDKDLHKALNVNMSACAKLWRRSVIEKYNVRFPENLLYEDANFCLKMFAVMPSVKVIRDSVYIYNRHQKGSIMSATFNKQSGLAIQHLYIIEEFYNFIRRCNLYQRGREILKAVYEPFFWFAYDNSPDSDHDLVLSTMSRILTEHNADVSSNPFVSYIKTYNSVEKSKLFMDSYVGPKHPNRGFFRKLFKVIKRK